MDKQEFVNKLVEVFPEYASVYRTHTDDYGKILLHVLASETISEPLIELLKYNERIDRIKEYCGLIEMMWSDGDDDVINVVEVTILEHLSDDRIVWHRFGEYISCGFKKYINEEVLENNVAMRHIEKLNA